MKERITLLNEDDNREIAQNLVNHLENEEDFEVIGMVKDGQEAFDMIKATTPDVVLLDVIMPHLDGLGVLEKINE